MKNILFINSSSDLYGADRSLLRTVKGLKDKYHFSVCLPYDGPLREELENIGVQTFVFDLGVLRRKFFTPLGIFKYAYNLISSIRAIRAIIEKDNIDIIHTNTSAVLAGAVAAKLSKIQHVWHIREIIKSPRIVRKYISYVVNKFSGTVIGVSRSTIENLKIDQPSIASKCIVIHNGIEVEKYHNPIDQPNILKSELQLNNDSIIVGMVGRISHWKGQDLFLKVAKRIVSGDKNVHFIAVGSPFEGQEWRESDLLKEVENSNLSENFHLVPFRNDIADVLYSFDIFIMPSTLPDPFPTTVLEAMSTSRPIIGNDHGGTSEMIVSNKSGILVEPNNVNQMASAVENLVQDHELRKYLGKNALERVEENFSYESYLIKMSDLYGSL